MPEGLLQPHGALLALAEPDLVIVMASASARDIVGVATPELLGAKISDVLGEAGDRALRELLRGELPAGACVEIAAPGGALDAVVHRASGLVVVEVERAAAESYDRRTLAALERLLAGERAAELAQITAQEVRALTGFDRVTVYRFVADTAEPVAEARRADLPPPPPRPSAVHELAPGERLRFVADPSAPSVPVVAMQGHVATALDLSAAVLRGVAIDPASLDPGAIDPTAGGDPGLACDGIPVEGPTGSTMSLAIEVGGALWGVVACEHETVATVPYGARAAARSIVRQLGGQLQLRERLADELRASNMAKDEFLATVSHELRTPLNAMLGWLRLIESGLVAPERQPQVIATVTRNAHVLAELVDELLDVSRIISGKMRLDLHPVAPRHVIEAALASVQPAADAKAIQITTSLDPSAAPVLADASRLQQILWNVLTNAVKFTPEYGLIEVSLVRSGTAAEIIVADRGAGIDPEFLPFVFDRFRQAPETIGRTKKGLGLGLSIVRHLVELHGGTVDVASEGLGRGTTVTVRLPISAVRSTTPTAELAAVALPVFEPAPRLRGLRVIAVDDEREANELVLAVLAASGVEVTTASSAAEVLELFPQVRPDILISDIQLPDLDGYELIQRVRALPPEEGGRVPAIAVTAFARGQDRSRAFLAGFDVYLAKPVDPAELTAVLVNLSGRRTGPMPRIEDAPGDGPIASGQLANARILVVDDDDDAAELLAVILRRHGAVVQVARTAAAAAAAIRGFGPDVLVSDLTLPDKDGCSLVREVRALAAEDGGWIPAIALSGRCTADDIKQAILAGFQLHVSKPVDPSDLVARLARLVARSQPRASRAPGSRC